jgi:acyl-coenzyme A thioesterase PaaI-like protein
VPDSDDTARTQAIADDEPGMFQRGHPASEFLRSWEWPVLEQVPGLLRVRASLPDQARNRRGQLFGGFTGTYVDLVASAVLRLSLPDVPRVWLATTGMRVEYLAPVLGPTFVVNSRVVSTRGRTSVVDTRFHDDDGEVTVLAVTSFRIVPVG